MKVVDSRRARGAATPVVLATVAILVLLAVAAWFLVIRPNREAVEANTPKATVTPAVAVSKAAPAPADVSTMSTDQLLAEARKALNEQRLLSPTGNNAFEFYLKVLERQPNNQVARDALRETFPFGANAAEQAINENNFAEAQREIALLAKADPENYTLTILRSKLDAQRKVVAQQQEDAQNQAQAEAAAQAQREKQQAAAAKAEAERVAAAKAAQEAAQKSASTQGSQDASQGQGEQAVATKPAPISIQDAVLVHEVRPRYPTSAIRNHQEGWVYVQFTVNTDGDVKDVSVVRAEPRHVFDRSAMNAVERWKFKPALRNGQPFAVTMQRRIVFTLGAR